MLKLPERSWKSSLDASCNAKPAVVAVVGPTATGKTALGVALAQRFSGEVISADSMQIYKGLGCGHCQGHPAGDLRHPAPWRGYPHPGKDLQRGGFHREGREQYIQDITARGHLPAPGRRHRTVRAEPFVRGALHRRKSPGRPARAADRRVGSRSAQRPCTRKLPAVDPEAAAAIHPNNKVRVLRALEHYHATGKRLSEQKADSLPPERPYRSLVLGLDFPDRAALYRRIDLRVDKCWKPGFQPKRNPSGATAVPFHTAAQAIGYEGFFPYFMGGRACELDACAGKAAKQASRNYAERQLTLVSPHRRRGHMAGRQGTGACGKPALPH